MAEPVTIGGQTFIKTADGWVDQKTKIRAPEGLLSLLNRLQSENSPEGKKKRVRIDTSRPVVKLGKTEYVWDLNSGVWIDKKTKDAANPAFSKLIEAAYQGIVQGKTEEEKLYENWAKKAAAGQVFTGMGVAGQAAKQKVKKPTGGGQLPVANVKINSPIIKMIEKLSVIDGYLKQRLANGMALANSQSVAAKEQAIEQPATQTDATPNLTENVDAEVEKTNKESQAILVAGAVAAGALFISQLDPVKETFNSIIGFAKGVYNFASGIVGVINEGLVRIVGTPESRGEQVSTIPGATPTANTEGSTSPTPSAGGGAEDSTAFPGPGESSASGNRASSGAASPEEITTPFPGPTSSSNTQRNTTSSGTPASTTTPAPSTADATQERSSSTAAPTTTTPSPSATPSSPTAAPAPTATPVQDDRNWWQRNMPSFLGGREAPTSSGATRTAAPAAGATSNQSLSRAVQLAAGQVGITKDGIGGYLRQGGVALDPRVEAWCAAFVNSTLAQAGLKGATNVANSFQKWGDRVEISAVQEGDIVIQTRNKGPDQTGGHIGIATGVRQGNKVELIAGNTSRKVKKYFLEDNTRNGLQIRRYNPEKPYGAGAVGGAPLGGENPLAAAGAAIANLSVGAMEAIGTILRAGLGSDTMRPTSGSQLSSVNDTMSGNIARAARERTSEVAAARTVENATTSSSASMNLNAPSSSVAVGGGPTASDRAGVEFYLTRMGFPPIHYTQTSWNATIR